MAGSADPSQAPARAALSRDRIVGAAVELVEAEGPAALTMRAVAQRLGAGTMSLYRHVSSREELLGLVLQSMASEAKTTSLTGDWRTDLTAIARDLRAGLLRRPALVVLLASRAGGGEAALPMLDRTLGVLRAAGFGRRGAVLANQALGSYVAGAVLREASDLAGTTGEDRPAPREAAADAVAQLPAERFPSISWAGPKLDAASADDRFEFGLRCLLDGFAAYLARRKG